MRKIIGIFRDNPINYKAFDIYLKLDGKVTDNQIDHKSSYSGSSTIVSVDPYLSWVSSHIENYFMNQYHPIVFVNTMGGGMSETDNNPLLWEYIPWLQQGSSIILGKKTRKDIIAESGSLIKRIIKHFESS